VRFPKVLLATSALAFIASHALAQTVQTSKNASYFQATTMNFISPTAPMDVSVTRPRSMQTIYAKTTSLSAKTVTITRKLNDGTVLGVTSLTATSATDPVSATFATPISFEAMNISPSALTGTDSISVTQVQAQTTSEH
jgi:hypothetical protein